MPCAVLMTAMVSPGEGLPVVRSVTVPVTVAAKAVAAHSIVQADDRMLRRVFFETGVMGVIGVIDKGQWVQFSIARLGMRLNSGSLLVTKVRPSCRQCAAIQRSLAPMARPWRSKRCRILP